MDIALAPELIHMFSNNTKWYIFFIAYFLFVLRIFLRKNCMLGLLSDEVAAYTIYVLFSIYLIKALTPNAYTNVDIIC